MSIRESLCVCEGVEPDGGSVWRHGNRPVRDLPLLTATYVLQIFITINPNILPVKCNSKLYNHRLLNRGAEGRLAISYHITYIVQSCVVSSPLSLSLQACLL